MGGLRSIAEMAAEVVTKHAKGLNLWLRLVETRTLRAAFLRCFGCREIVKYFNNALISQGLLD